MDSWEIARNRIVVPLLLTLAFSPVLVAIGFVAVAASYHDNHGAAELFWFGWYILRFAVAFGWPLSVIGFGLLLVRRVDRAFSDFGATVFGIGTTLVGMPLADGVPYLWLVPTAGVVLAITAAPGIARAARGHSLD